MSDSSKKLSLKSVWPVESWEVSKFLPLFIIKLLVSFIYTVLFSIKDSIVVAHIGGGAEVIPALKGTLVVVGAFACMLAYTKLSNILSRDNLFYTVLFFFLGFFCLFGLVLFPMRDSLVLTTMASAIDSVLGPNNSHWSYIVKYWMNSLFFVFSELWGGVIIAVLFWGFVNQISSIKEAAKFYTLYSLGGHFGSIIAGLITVRVSSAHHLSYEFILLILTGIVVVSGLVIAGLYYFVTNKVLVGSTLCDSSVASKKSDKPKLSMFDSIKYIITSPHLGWIALILVGYCISVNLVEVTWKAIIKMYYTDMRDYQKFLGVYQTILGCFSIVLALFFSGPILRKKGWLFSARLTPIVMSITSGLFFAIYFYVDGKFMSANSGVTFFGLSPLLLLVIVGSIHNMSCKAMKYCVFDPTKEMAYIPLDLEGKVKGKAAVDLVGARFGKSGSSWIHICLLFLTGSGSVFSIVPYLVPCLAVTIFLWLLATGNLDKSIRRETAATKNSSVINNAQAAV